MPTPSQMTKSGASITRGTALSTIITGSSNSATSRQQCRGHAEHDADGDADSEAAERGGEGRFEMRPDAAVDKELGERGADRLGIGA